MRDNEGYDVVIGADSSKVLRIVRNVISVELEGLGWGGGARKWVVKGSRGSS